MDLDNDVISKLKFIGKIQKGDKINVKNVVGIEPSIDSIELGNEKINKFGFKGKINVINGVGDIDWISDDKYIIVLENKYDLITFQFTLHYMMNNIQTIINNLDSVEKLIVNRDTVKVITSNRDPKFVASQWRDYLKELQTKI